MTLFLACVRRFFVFWNDVRGYISTFGIYSIPQANDILWDFTLDIAILRERERIHN